MEEHKTKTSPGAGHAPELSTFKSQEDHMGLINMKLHRSENDNLRAAIDRAILLLLHLAGLATVALLAVWTIGSALGLLFGGP